MKWINVNDKTPEKDGKIIVYTCSGSIDVGWYRVKNHEWVDRGSWQICVDYWMPLPDSPKDK